MHYRDRTLLDEMYEKRWRHRSCRPSTPICRATAAPLRSPMLARYAGNKGPARHSLDTAHREIYRAIADRVLGLLMRLRRGNPSAARRRDLIDQGELLGLKTSPSGLG